MKIEIKHRFTGSVLFAIEADSWRVAVEAAVKSRVDLSSADLYGANLYGAYLYGADLSGANLYGADLSGANLYGADLSGAVLYGAYLYGANLYGADLSGAVLYGAYLYGADLSRADLSSAVLSGTNLYGADLSGAKIRGHELIGKSPVCIISLFGSADRSTVFYHTKDGIYVHCGCFFGPVKDFVKQVKKRHKRNQYAKEYRAALELVKIRFRRKSNE